MEKCIALYLRLSQSDNDLNENDKDESNSIENQRALLRNYLENRPEMEGSIQEYIDDG